MRKVRVEAIVAAFVALVALAAASAAPGARSQEPPGSVSVTSVPNVATGDTITMNGVVARDGVPVPGIDVTVRLYTLPGCSSGAAPKTILTTGPDGSFAFTDTISVVPPLSYGFIVGLSQDPNRAPNFTSGPDTCVTLNAAPSLSAKAQGDVTVNGVAFTSGVIANGSTVDVGAGSTVNIATDVGKFRFYPVKGGSTSFVTVRVPLPKVKGKKRRFVVELRLVGGDFSRCPGGKQVNGFRTEAAKKPPPRSLWGSGKGHYRTKGRYSSATVSGTNWLVEDLCGGTLTVVRNGVVRVFDFAKHKTVIVRAGHRYLAKPR